MNTGVKEREQAKHPPILDEEIPAECFADGRDRQRHGEQPERPQPGFDLQLADRIRAEPVVGELPRDPGKRQEGRDKDQRLLPRDPESRPDVPPAPRRRANLRDACLGQKFFLRSIPAYMLAT
jgi:hypothetical protein